MLFQLISGMKVKLVDNMIQSNYLCVILHVNPRTYKQIHTPIVLQGRGVEGGWNPFPEFSIYCSILKRFYL